MMILITYDVETVTAEGRKRLRQVAKQCVNYGQRVQNSVFECILEPVQLKALRYKLEDIIDPQKDSIRFYHLGNNWVKKVDQIGLNDSRNFEDDVLMV